MKSDPEFKKLDEEVMDFYKNLKKKNFEEDEIYQIFKPFLEEKKKPVGKFFFLLMSIFVLFQIVLKTEMGWWYILAISRMFLIQIKPFYDWSHLKNDECLLSKWWEQNAIQNFTPNCNFCENQIEIDVLKHLESEHLEEFYLDVQKPVILQDEGNPTVDALWSSLYQDDNFLSSYPCHIESNLMGNRGTAGKILRKMSIFEDFFVHFQNCEYESMKYFRNIVPMPQIGLRHISPVQYNWLIWSKSYTFSKFKKIGLSDVENIKLIYQIEGEIMYRLIPPETCGDVCKEIKVLLKKHQVLLFTNFWRLEYNISRNFGNENVGVILEAHSIL